MQGCFAGTEPELRPELEPLEARLLLSGEPILSEFLAANDSGLQDEDGDFSDWLEIHNPSDAPIDLAGWYLTDDAADLAKWEFPAVTVPAGGYILLFASDKDRRDPVGELHTNFKIGADGEYLALVDPALDVACEYAPAFPTQWADISYGLYEGTQYYFVTPTPGAANDQGMVGRVADTAFSVDRGFYDAPFQVEITTATLGATIVYTTDGSAPSPGHGLIYAGPIDIVQSTPLRAMAYRSDMLPTNVDTQTYLFFDHPVDYTGAALPAYPLDVQQALLTLPTLSIVMSIQDFVTVRDSGDGTIGDSGDNKLYERPCSVELIYPAAYEGAGAGFQINCGVRPHSWPGTGKRSLKLVFFQEYGAGKLDYPIFESAAWDAESAADSFDKLILRANSNDGWESRWGGEVQAIYIRDQFARDVQIDMGGLGSHGTFVHLYVNGEYFGLYNPCERPDDDFQASYLGGGDEDYFAFNHGGPISGDSTIFDTMHQLARSADLSDPAQYVNFQSYLDVRQFADYLIASFYATNPVNDWPVNNGRPQNFYGGNSNVPAAGVQYFVWDAEFAFRWDACVHEKFRPTSFDKDKVFIAAWFALIENGDFLTLFADRAYKHLANDGVLSPARAAEHLTAWADFIRTGVTVAEDWRWHKDGSDWEASLQIALSRTQTNPASLIASMRQYGYYPSIDPPLMREGGSDIQVTRLRVAAGFELELVDPNGGAGLVYYTLDGSDPRLSGGGISPDALTANAGETVAIDRTTLLRARVWDGAEWSALHEVRFIVDGGIADLRVTEVMYHPAPASPAETAQGYTNADDFEFIELLNTGPAAINLYGVCLSGAVDYTFGDVDLAPGQYVVVAGDAAAFEARYGPAVGVPGAYDGRLANDGEALRLTDALGQVLLDFAYDDAWFDLTDGLGFSLVVLDPTAPAETWSDPASWRPSDSVGGSPGRSDSGLAPGSVLINELLAHSDEATGDWIELYNATDEPIDIGGWFLSDDPADPWKYRIADGTTLEAGDWIVFTQTDDFGALFALSELGDEVVLSSANAAGEPTGYRETASFGASDNGVPFGRYVKSTGKSDFVAMSVGTPGAANAAPRVGPVVLNEIHYHPLTGEEFIELRNITGVEVALYDAANDNPWRFTDGVEFAFPPGAAIAAGGLALVVPIDPAAFRAACGVPAEVPIYGPYVGVLDDGGEGVTLSRPGNPEPDASVPYVVVERVVYDDDPPWYVQADGAGSSLVRVESGQYGNDVANWALGNIGGTPGATNVVLDMTPPTAPAGLTAAVSAADRIDLTWQAAADPETGIDSYVIYRNGVALATAGAESYSDTGVGAGVGYTYEVSAVNGDGIEGARGEAAGVSILALVSVQVHDPNHVSLAFSGALSAATAGDAGNYSIAGAAVYIATLAPGGQSVSLVTSTLLQNQSYTLTVAAVTGEAGGQLPPGTQAQLLYAARVTEGLVVLYDLEEGSGATVHDTSGAGSPLDLTVQNTQAVTWITGGLAIDSATIVSSAVAATKIIDAVRASGAITIEAWVKPASVSQSGPARIVTLSADPYLRDFTLGQDSSVYDIRLRTTATSSNGVPSVGTPVGTATTALTHVVYTRSAAGAVVIYVDGLQRKTSTISGSLTNLDSTYRLALANELTMDRPWRGDIYLVAVYDQALSAAGVTQNYEAGPQPNVDRTGPQVVASWPQQDQLVPPGSVVCTVQFNEPLDAAALSEADFQLVGSASGPHAPAAWTYEPTLATLNLEYAGLPTDSYTLSLSGAIADEAGNGLDGDGDGGTGEGYELSFRTTYSGDADLNGAVDYEDYKRVLIHFGQSPAQWADGDFDLSGTVDYEDYKAILANFGSALTAGGLAPLGEAEPAPAAAPAAQPTDPRTPSIPLTASGPVQYDVLRAGALPAAEPKSANHLVPSDAASPDAPPLDAAAPLGSTEALPDGLDLLARTKSLEVLPRP